AVDDDHPCPLDVAFAERVVLQVLHRPTGDDLLSNGDAVGAVAPAQLSPVIGFAARAEMPDQHRVVQDDVVKYDDALQIESRLKGPLVVLAVAQMDDGRQGWIRASLACITDRGQLR